MQLLETHIYVHVLSLSLEEPAHVRKNIKPRDLLSSNLAFSIAYAIWLSTTIDNLYIIFFKNYDEFFKNINEASTSQYFVKLFRK